MNLEKMSEPIQKLIPSKTKKFRVQQPGKRALNRVQVQNSD